MTTERTTARALTIALMVIAIAAGCARRPVAIAASAPAPAPTRNGPSSAAELGAQQRPASGSPSTRVSAQRPRPGQFTSTIALEDIHFDLDRYDLRAADTKVLDMNAAWLQDNTHTLLLVEGHADERGTNEYNLALGARRAKAAVDYLVSQGVHATRIATISYGEERPICAQRTEACWARNRRAHFLVTAR